MTLGLGTSATSLDIKSNGSNMTCVVPLDQGVFSSYRTLPLRVIDRRFVDTAGLLSTGIEIQVPEYLESGERIRVNTTTGKFVSRA